MASFALVVKHGSFTAAAKALEVPRSTVSQHISSLENQLDVKLLSRNTRKLSLTAAGEVYVKYCMHMLTAAEEANLALNEWRDQPTGKLRITAPEASGTTIHGKVITQFQQLYPNISIEMLVSDTTMDIVSNSIDVAFRTGRLQDSNLICKKISNLKRVVVASPDYIKQFGVPDIQTLQKHNCIIHDSLPKWPLTSTNKTVNIDVNGTVSSNSLLFIKEASINGQGLALLPIFFCKESIREQKLITIDTLKVPDNRYYAIYLSRNQQPKALKCFLDFVKRYPFFKD